MIFHWNKWTNKRYKYQIYALKRKTRTWFFNFSTRMCLTESPILAVIWNFHISFSSLFIFVFWWKKQVSYISLIFQRCSKIQNKTSFFWFRELHSRSLETSLEKVIFVEYSSFVANCLYSKFLIFRNFEMKCLFSASFDYAEKHQQHRFSEFREETFKNCFSPCCFQLNKVLHFNLRLKSIAETVLFPNKPQE